MLAILETCLHNVAIENRVLLIIVINFVRMRVHFQLNTHVIVFKQTLFTRRLSCFFKCFGRSYFVFNYKFVIDVTSCKIE